MAFRRAASWSVALAAVVGASAAGSAVAAEREAEESLPPPRAIAAPRRVAPRSAAAPPRYTPFVDRGAALTAPWAYGTLGWAATAQRRTRTELEGNVGGGVGLTSRLWIDGSVGVLRIAPDTGYHSPVIGLGVLILDRPGVEIDAALHVGFASADRRPVELVEPGLFGVARVAHKLRFDGGVYVGIHPGGTELVGLRVPASVAFQITERIHAVIGSGVTVDDLRSAATAAIPLGLTLGFSDLVGERPWSLGVVPSITLPELVKPGTPERFRPDYVVVGITFVAASKY